MLLVTLVSETFCIRSREKPKERLVLNLIIQFDLCFMLKIGSTGLNDRTTSSGFRNKQECHQIAALLA